MSSLISDLSDREAWKFRKQFMCLWVILVALRCWKVLRVESFPSVGWVLSPKGRKLGNKSIAMWDVKTSINSKTVRWLTLSRAKPTNIVSKCQNCQQKGGDCIAAGTRTSAKCTECLLFGRDDCDLHDPASYRGPGRKPIYHTPEAKKRASKERNDRALSRCGGSSFVRRSQIDAKVFRTCHSYARSFLR